MKKIPLTQGKFAIVDDADFERLSRYKWYARRKRKIFYAYRGVHILGTKKGPLRIWMHRFIMGRREGFEIDHCNRNGLDNRRQNLRWATNRQNTRNVGLTSRNTSGYKGVSWFKAKARWRADICVSYREIYLGCYNTRAAAARAYDAAARKHFGKFAFLNFPEKEGHHADPV